MIALGSYTLANPELKATLRSGRLKTLPTALAPHFLKEVKLIRSKVIRTYTAIQSSDKLADFSTVKQLVFEKSWPMAIVILLPRLKTNAMQ